ncbi:MAG: DUF2782 domain-containing protein [Gammaproteobacteria bacterium]|jgi:hypothetical protein|nr:MAG: DUF2782 domain-containing protein [Gammaproteobacteria bacterium]
MKRRMTLALLSLFIIFAATAQEEEFADAPEPPDLPDPVVSGQPIEPEITIIRKEKETIQEYRLNGRLYMVKITPVVGKPYYLMDRNGDGTMEYRIMEDYERERVPQWVLFSW